MPIEEAIEQAKRMYRDSLPECLDALLPPADESAIDGITTELSLPVPPELRAIYRVHGGQLEVPPGNNGLFGMHRLLTPSELVENYLMTSSTCVDDPVMFEPGPEGEPPYWDNQLLPFALWNDSYLCVHSMNEDVWYFRPYEGLGRRHWSNIEAALREAMEGVRALTAEKPSWRKHLPPTATDLHEFTEVALFLPTCCWSMLKARIAPSEFDEIVAHLQLAADVDRKYPPPHNRDWLWNAAPGFEGNWWDASPALDKTFISESEDPSIIAKHENGFLYLMVSQSLTHAA